MSTGIRVAFCISNHPNFTQIDHEKERTEISNQLNNFSISLAHKPAVTEDQLAAAINRASDGVNILHFVGPRREKRNLSL